MALRLVALAALSGLAVAHDQDDQDVATRMHLKQQAISLGVICEDMCKKVNAYPNCQCPGFGGMPADEGDTRSCAVKYCHPPADPCPNDGFFNCVKSTTELLQTKNLPSVPALMQQLITVQRAVAKYASNVFP